jgi:DNA-binding response OmpR family regulator
MLDAEVQTQGIPLSRNPIAASIALARSPESGGGTGSGAMSGQQQSGTSLPSRFSRRIWVHMLLVGSEDAFKLPSEWLETGNRVRILTRASSLLEAMACLDSKVVGQVTLSREFSDEELKLFVLAVRRRGFEGPIWRVGDASEGASKSEVTEEKRIQVGDFLIDAHRRLVWVRGAETQLEPMEFELLNFFCSTPERRLSHETLLASVWGHPIPSRSTLRGVIYELRTKIETTNEPRYILTERSFGYRFVPGPRTVL